MKWSMKTIVTVSLFIFVLLLSGGSAAAKTFYLSDGSTIEYLKVWKKGEQIFLLINRDTLVQFQSKEVDQRTTLRAAGLKKFPPPPVQKSEQRTATPAQRKKALAAPSPARNPAPAEERPVAFSDSRETVLVTAAEDNVPEAARVGGRYSNLVQIMHCPKDGSSYGSYRDYGWWGGGPWCGQAGKAGYWVWVAPNWYVWSGQK